MANIRRMTDTWNASSVDHDGRRDVRRSTIVAAFATVESARAARDAVLALTPRVHHDLVELRPTSDAVDRLVDDNLARGGAHGAVLGAIGLGTVSFLVTMLAIDAGAALALTIAAAIAFTGGPFFGGLAGFTIQTYRWDAIRNEVKHLLDRRNRTASVLITRTRHVGLLAAVLTHHGGEVIDSRAGVECG